MRSVGSRSIRHLKKKWRCMDYQAIQELEKGSGENEGGNILKVILILL